MRFPLENYQSRKTQWLAALAYMGSQRAAAYARLHAVARSR